MSSSSSPPTHLSDPPPCRYLVSYVQSLFVVDAYESLPPAEMQDHVAAVDALSVYEILARTKYTRLNSMRMEEIFDPNHIFDIYFM